MTTIATDTVQTLSIIKEVEINAPVHITFASILDEVGPESQMPDGSAFPFILEAWPGGRWFRDLGDARGHFWGHVQVIKPPTLLELCGPMFMSYPAMNFVQYRLVALGTKTRLTLTHRAIGLIPPDHREGVHMGWNHGLKRIDEIARARVAGTHTSHASKVHHQS